MLTLRATDSADRPVIILGLSFGNLDRLRQGQPISFDLAKLNLVGTILICAGETEQALANKLLGEAKQAGVEIRRGDPPADILKRTT